MIAQITFTISFVVVVMNARLAGMDPRLEHAAMDVYATPFQRFRDVTFPIYIWSAAQKGIPPQVNVISTIMFMSSLLLVLVAGMVSKRSKLKQI